MPDSAPRGKRSPTETAHPTYHGHKRSSYDPFDIAEMVELRAHQRTFDNAYVRTMLATLAYGILVLKVFDKRFYTGMRPTVTRSRERT
jgi:predicted outer membrane protein